MRHTARGTTEPGATRQSPAVPRKRRRAGSVPPVAVLLVLAASLRGADDTQAMLARVSEEADAFRRLAPSLLGQETLEQKARKPASRFRPRVGASAKGPPPPVWQDRQIVSEYGFVSFAGEQETLHELRRVISVDTRLITDKKNEDSLARIIVLKDDQRKKELLKEFQKYGLVGAVTDFGPLLMLFTPREIEHFEFSLKGSQSLGATKALIFRYTQIDGAELLTIFDKDKPQRLKVQGELWVRADNYLPLRVTLAVGEGQGASTVREEASVDYSPSAFGVLVPSSVDHKELIGGQLAVQNSFIYKDFHKFGADSEIQFAPDKPAPQK
jgi:hypothetical protein